MYSRLGNDVDEMNGRREGALLLLAGAFVLLNALALTLVRENRVVWAHLWSPLVWVLVMGLAHVLLFHFRPRHDPLLLPIFSLLGGWGIILIDRLAANFLARQVLWLVLSTTVLLAVAILPRDLRILRRYRYTWLLGGLLLLATTFLFGMNPSGSGAALWLPLPVPFYGRVFFQPSELLKLLLVVFLASYFAEREVLLRSETHRGLRGVLPYLAPLLLMWGFCMVLLAWQRDLGAAALFFAVFLAMLYVATGDGRYVLLGLSLFLAAGAAVYFLLDDLVAQFTRFPGSWTSGLAIPARLIHELAAARVDAWWNPWPDASGNAFQIAQSLYAVASGGVLGQGVAQGFPDYIPVVHSDFAFAAVAEEWGLIGSLAVVACFMMLSYRGLRAAIHNRRPFRVYLATGITVLFSVQALLIMGGVTKLLPLTGVTLPFVSYGGSSLLVSSAMLGLLIHLSNEQAATPAFNERAARGSSLTEIVAATRDS